MQRWTAALIIVVGCSSESAEKQAAKGPSDPSDWINGRTTQMSNSPVNRCNYEEAWTNVDSFALETGQSATPKSIAFSRSGSVFVGGYANAAGQAGSLSIVRELPVGEDSFSTIDTYSYDSDNNTSLNAIAVGTSGLPLFTLDEYHGASGGKSRGMVRTVDETDAASNLHDQVYVQDGLNTHILDIATHEDGSIYSVGWGLRTSPSVFNKGFLRISTDSGETWTEKEFQVSSASTTNRLYYISLIDSYIYVTGLGGITDDCSNNTVFVARSSDEGDSWEVLESYCSEASTAAFPSSRVFKDSAGNLYYNTYSNTAGNVWEIRHSSDNGASWSTVHEYQHTAGKPAQGYQFVQGDDGVIYNVGTGNDTNNFSYAVILQSSNFGLTWTTFEETQLDENYSARYYGIAKDPSGDLWSILSGGRASDGKQWHVRRRRCQ